MRRPINDEAMLKKLHTVKIEKYFSLNSLRPEF
jgi:hypothetical protein